MEKIPLQAMGLRESLIFFAIPTLLLYIATHIAVPALSQAIGLPIVVSWFICGGTIVFLPLFVAAFVFYRLEGNLWQTAAVPSELRFALIATRFRLNQPPWQTLQWTGLGIVGIGVLTYGIVAVGQAIVPGFSAQPSFMSVPPLSSNNHWILAAWIPLFFFNIVGEGLFWRGYIFPRQELAFGQSTWFVHGCFWWMFHIPFGGTLLVTLSPIIFITSFVVQRTKSTWSDLMIHALINGSGFLLVAFGVVG